MELCTGPEWLKKPLGLFGFVLYYVTISPEPEGAPYWITSSTMDVAHCITVSLNAQEIDEIYYWCMQNCNKFRIGNSADGERLYFMLNSQEDALLFKLKWGHVK